jgi:hypothetical protein
MSVARVLLTFTISFTLLRAIKIKKTKVEEMRIILMIATVVMMSGWPASPAYAERQAVIASSAESEAYNPLGRQEVKFTRKLIQDNRRAIVSFDVGLTDEEEENFWPVYDSYRKATMKVNDALVNLIIEYGKAQKSGKLTDKQAVNMTIRSLKIKQDRIKVKSAFIKKFNKVLSGKKVARFYQVDHRLDIIDNIEISDAVPLAE